MSSIGFASFGAEDPHVCGDARGQGRFDGEEEGGEVRLWMRERERLNTSRKVKIHKLKHHPKRYELKGNLPPQNICEEARKGMIKSLEFMNQVVS